SRRGIPALTTELGSGATLDPKGLLVAEQGVRRVLRHYGITPNIDCFPPDGTRLLSSLGPRHAIYAPAAGLMEPVVQVGDLVQKGQPALRLHNLRHPLNEPLTLSFSADGVVSCRRFPTLCARGDGLFHLATPLEEEG
ncbi:MAG: succinylglutamate desuccinylase/aspartoacylase family protein, partial [Advenella sp.]